jgi:hypothetical protein
MSLMSIMSYEVMPVISGTTMGVNYGFDKLRFISPVRSGSRVRATRADSQAIWTWFAPKHRSGQRSRRYSGWKRPIRKQCSV